MNNNYWSLLLAFLACNILIINCSSVKSIKNKVERGGGSTKVNISTNPSGASYFIAHRYDGGERYSIVKEGKTPDEVTVKINKGKPYMSDQIFEIVVRKKGYLEKSREFLPEKGKTTNIDLELTEKPKIHDIAYDSGSSKVIEVKYDKESKYFTAYENEILSYGDSSTSIFFPYRDQFGNTVKLSMKYKETRAGEVGVFRINDKYALGFYLTSSYSSLSQDLRSPMSVSPLPIEKISYLRTPYGGTFGEKDTNTDMLSEKQLRVIPGKFTVGQRVRQVVNGMRRKLLQIRQVNKYLPHFEDLQALRVEDPTSEQEDIEVLKSLKNQQHLRNVVFKFTDTENLSNQFLEEVISNLTQITHLTLQARDFTDQKLKYIQKLDNLRSLDISDNQQITSIGIQFLTDLDNLHTLDISENDNIDNEGLEYVSKLSSLEKLNARSIGDISKNGLKHLSDLGRLKVLNLGGSNDFKGTDLSFLTSLESLKVLVLDASITSNVLKHVGQSEELTTLDISGARIDSSGFRHLKGLDNLKQLKMYGAIDIQYKHLKNLVSSLDSLKELHMNKRALSKKNLSRLRINHDQFEVVTP